MQITLSFKNPARPPESFADFLKEEGLITRWECNGDSLQVEPSPEATRKFGVSISATLELAGQAFMNMRVH